MNLRTEILDGLSHKLSNDALKIAPFFAEQAKWLEISRNKIKEVDDIEVLAILSHFGLSNADIIYLVVVSAILLFATFG